MSLGKMITRIHRETRRDGLTADIRDYVETAIDYYKTERLWFNEQESTANVSTGQVSVSFPTNFTQIDELILVDGDTRYGDEAGFHRVPWQTVAEWEEDDTGQPYVWAVFDEQIFFRPIPDKAYELRASGVREFTEVSASASTGATNAWMTDGEALIRSHVKADLYEHVLRNQGMADRMRIAAQREYSRLKDRTTKAISTGRVKKTRF